MVLYGIASQPFKCIPMTQAFRFLGLSGSLRRASNSTAVMRGLQDALAPRVALNIFSLHGDAAVQ
jgi:hypothetical protein